VDDKTQQQFERYRQSQQHLVDAYNIAFRRDFETDKPVDRVVFGFGLLCKQDFEDILLLSFNGRGFGGQKLLRGMFERTVVAHHLQRNPGDCEPFLDFHYLNDYRLVASMAETFGEENLPLGLLADKKKLRDSVKSQFTKVCSQEGCERTVPNFTWHSLDMVAMAKACGATLGGILAIGYYLPMVHTHATIGSILQQMDTDGIIGRPEHSAQWAGKSLCAAHNLLLQNLILQLRQFPDLTPDLKPVLRECGYAFHDIWGEPGTPRPDLQTD